MNNRQDNANKGRKQLSMLIALFLVPPIAAYLAWVYLQESGVSSTTNTGELVSPARPLNVDGLVEGDQSTFDKAFVAGHWTYVILAENGCDEVCQEKLYLTRQFRVSVNKDMSRVQRLLVLGQQPSSEFMTFLEQEHEFLNWVVLPSNALNQNFIQTFKSAGDASNSYFLVDPLANLMMRYDLSMPSSGVLKDLRKLLKISQVG